MSGSWPRLWPQNPPSNRLGGWYHDSTTGGQSWPLCGSCASSSSKPGRSPFLPHGCSAAQCEWCGKGHLWFEPISARWLTCLKAWVSPRSIIVQSGRSRLRLGSRSAPTAMNHPPTYFHFWPTRHLKYSSWWQWTQKPATRFPVHSFVDSATLAWNSSHKLRSAPTLGVAKRVATLTLEFSVDCYCSSCNDCQSPVTCLGTQIFSPHSRTVNKW